MAVVIPVCGSLWNSSEPVGQQRAPCGCNTLLCVVFSKHVLSTLCLTLPANVTPSTLFLLSVLLPVEGLSARARGKQVFEGSNVTAFSTECTESWLEEKQAVFCLYCRVVPYMTYITVKDPYRFCNALLTCSFMTNGRISPLILTKSFRKTVVYLWFGADSFGLPDSSLYAAKPRAGFLELPSAWSNLTVQPTSG